MSVRIFSFLEDIVADRDPGTGAFLTRGSGIRIWDPGRKKNPDPGFTSRVIFPRV
jgi:hypothetical protein